MAIHRLQLQGEVEVVLVNTPVDTSVLQTNDGITTSSSSSSSSSTSTSSSSHKGGSVEICVRLLGEILSINPLSDDEDNNDNRARASQKGLYLSK